MTEAQDDNVQKDAPPGKPLRQAVALSYDARDTAPRVVAKGYGTVAENIIRCAREHNLYVHDAPEMVSVLMHLDLDQHIPPALYEAVAGILTWLYRLEEATYTEAERHDQSHT